MKKIKEFCKNNWVFLLFIIPFYFITLVNKVPDNDIWFLLNNGRYVLNVGIPTIDPFSIHEGLQYVMQQWGAASVFWAIYSIFGEVGILLLMYIMFLLLIITYYKLCYVVSEKKVLSVIITTIVFFLIRNFFVTRPQIFTYLILMLEILVIELFIKKKNNKYLFVLPLLSLLIINLHASMWYFLFVFLVPFMLNCINLKEFKIDKYNFLPLLYSAIAMFIVGFFNPYGYKALTFIFKSYGIASINNYINEMKPLSFEYGIGIAVVLILIFIIFTLLIRKKVRYDIRHFLFISGTTLLAFMHLKCYPIFIIVVFYTIAYAFKNYKFKLDYKIFKSKIFGAISRGVVIASSVLLIFTFCVASYFGIKNYEFKQWMGLTSYVEVVDYILNNYNKDEVVLYADFDIGGYTEFMGLKSYIDGRAELFFERFNGKEDIFDEAMAVVNDREFDHEKFINKYNFTHLIVIHDTFLDEYLVNNENYEIREQNYLNDGDKEPFLKIYVRKDVEVLG